MFLLALSAERSIRHAETISHRELALSGDVEFRRRSENPAAPGAERDRAGFLRGPDISQRGRFSFSGHARRGFADSAPSRFRGSEPKVLCAPKEWRRMAARRGLCPRTRSAAGNRNCRPDILWRAIFGAADAAFSRAQGRARLRGISVAARQALGNAGEAG